MELPRTLRRPMAAQGETVARHMRRAPQVTCHPRRLAKVRVADVKGVFGRQRPTCAGRQDVRQRAPRRRFVGLKFPQRIWVPRIKKCGDDYIAASTGNIPGLQVRMCVGPTTRIRVGAPWRFGPAHLLHFAQRSSGDDQVAFM